MTIVFSTELTSRQTNVEEISHLKCLCLGKWSKIWKTKQELKVKRKKLFLQCIQVKVDLIARPLYLTLNILTILSRSSLNVTLLHKLTHPG